MFRVARFQGINNTLVGQLNDVFAVDVFGSSSNSDSLGPQLLSMYFGKNIGWISTENVDSLGIKELIIQLSYAKIEEKTYGKLLTDRDLNINDPRKAALKISMASKSILSIYKGYINSHYRGLCNDSN